MATSTAEAKTGGTTDIAKLTKVQKLAILLVMLGPESAAQVLRNLEAAEVEAVCAEMSKLSLIDQQLQREILREFSEVAVEASTSIQGGIDFTRSALEKGLGLFKASDIIGRIAPARTPVSTMQVIVDMDPGEIYNLLRHEQPQTIALVLSFVTSETAAEVVSLFSLDQRDKILERVATLAPTPIEVVEKVVEVLQAKAGVRQTRALSQTGGVKTAANVLNAMEKEHGKTALLALEERNPELCQAIRQKMFTFEDLADLEQVARQRILREVDLRDLAIALKTASEKLKTALLSCISKRAAETVHEEISCMGPVRLRDIENAQLRIIEVVRRLESDGEIDLGTGRNNALYEVV